jgi:DNA-binding MarR family transcriptional regulator
LSFCITFEILVENVTNKAKLTMTDPAQLDLSDFLPYLLSQAADRQGGAFSPVYKDRYGMLRTEWRVVFHLGQYGDLTAKDVCNRAQIHKTKVSRAVTALESKRFVSRHTVVSDRRHALLRLTPLGRTAYRDLSAAAARFDEDLKLRLGAADTHTLKRCLLKLAGKE